MLIPKEKLTDLDIDLQQLLVKLSQATGDTQYVVTSGRRTQDANAAITGAVQDSAHLDGLAVDIAHDGDIVKAMRLVYWAGRLGIVRIGLYTRHVHLDIDKTKPQTQWAGVSH